jgi:acetyl-CoA acetyltransferase
MTGREPLALVVGVGESAYGRGTGRSEWEQAVEAVSRALADAGLAASDVDGLVRYSYDEVDEAMLTRSLGLRLRYYSQAGYGGLGAPAVLGHASAAVASGLARVVVCYRSLNGWSRTRYGRAERTLGAAGDSSPADLTASGDRAPSGAFAGPYGLLSPGQVMALWAREYQWKAGLTEAQLAGALGQVAIGQRRYASANHRAIMRDRPLDMAGYLDGRMISSPLRLFDLALESDGAAAVVVAAPPVAAALSRPGVRVLAATAGLFPYAESVSVYGELRNGPQYRRIGAELLRSAGVRPADIAAAMIYDATTISVLLGLEAYGFHEPFTAWRAVTAHGIGPASPLPVNTSGGHLSEAYVHGMNLLTEAVRQCRGESASQVSRPGPVLVSSGPSAVVLAP